MKSYLLAFTLAIYGSTYTNAQFVTPPPAGTFKTVKGPLNTTVRYQQVPTGPGSICEQHANVTSYSGFVDINANQHVFFWFFGAREIDPKIAPLTAWTSGGPGDSSMSELFTENGPCSINEDSSVSNNPYSWNARSNMVYIDQPIDVGFSYSNPVKSYIDQDTCELHTIKGSSCPAWTLNLDDPNGDCDGYSDLSACGTFGSFTPSNTANSTEGAAVTFYLALQGLFAAFPAYTAHGFNFASESYGGHYVPVFSRYIANQNKNLQTGAIAIPQQAILIQNGWMDPTVQYPSFYNYTVNPGNPYGVTVSQAAAAQMEAAFFGKGNCSDRLQLCNSPQGTDQNCQNADDWCTNYAQSIYDNDTMRDEYDMRYLIPNPFPPEWYIDYLNDPDNQAELAVYTNYTEFSYLIEETFEVTGDDAKRLGIPQAITNLLDSGVTVTIYHGDTDYNCNWLGGEIVVAGIAANSKTSGLAAAYAAAGYQNLTTSDGVVHGQVKQAGNLAFVRVYYAGHQVGFYQPIAAQTIFQRTSAGLDIATGQISTALVAGKKLYATVGPAKSTYKEGGRTVTHKVLPEDATYNHDTNLPNY